MVWVLEKDGHIAVTDDKAKKEAFQKHGFKVKKPEPKKPKGTSEE